MDYQVSTNQEIGKNLRLERIKAGMTQKQLANKLRSSGITIDNNVISAFERGTKDFTIDMVKSLALALDCSEADLTGRKQDVELTPEMVTSLEAAVSYLKKIVK